MIIPFIWRLLPGPAAVKALELAVLAGLVVVACFTWVFPWLSAEVLPQPDATIPH